MSNPPERTVAEIQAKWDAWRLKINDRACTEFDWPEAANPRQLGLYEVLVDELGRLWRVEPWRGGIKMKMMIDPNRALVALPEISREEYDRLALTPGYVVWRNAEK